MTVRASAWTGALLCALVLVPAGAAAQDFLPRDTKKGFIRIADGIRIHYLEATPRGAGAAGRPTILLVPGWMLPAWIWEHQIAFFSKTHRVVAMDPRSQGNSSKPSEGNHPASRARDIQAVVEKLELAPVVLVGATMAVAEIASYVDQFGTESLAALVLVNGIAGRDFDAASAPALLQYANAFALDRRAAAERFVRGLFVKAPGEPYIRRLIDATLLTPTNSALALFLGSFTADFRTALPRIDKPTLIIVAAVPAWMSLYEDLQNRIRDSRLEVLPGAGHALFVEEAPRFNALLADFLARQRAPEGASVNR